MMLFMLDADEMDMVVRVTQFVLPVSNGAVFVFVANDSVLTWLRLWVCPASATPTPTRMPAVAVTATAATVTRALVILLRPDRKRMVIPFCPTRSGQSID